MTAERLRLIAGVAILLSLLLFAILLAPAYWRNHQFQRSLDAIVAQGAGASDDAVRAAVVESAARLKLPVTADHVRVRRDRGRLELDVPYALPVNLSLYTVDLHFRPKAHQ